MNDFYHFFLSIRSDISYYNSIQQNQSLWVDLDLYESCLSFLESIVPSQGIVSTCSSILLCSVTKAFNAFLSFLFINYHLYNLIIDIIVFSNTLSVLQIGRIVLSAALIYPSYFAILAQASRLRGEMTISSSSFIILFWI